MKRTRPPLIIILSAAAVGAMAAPAAYGQDGMGRLFYTPAQRAQLDTARQRNVRAPIPGDQPEEAQPLPQEVTVNGMIRRNDGRTTVWLNNRMVAPDAQTGGGAVEVRPRGDSGVTLALPQSGRSVDLKVGQSVEALSGQIADVFQRRSLTVPPDSKPAPAAPPAGTVEKVTPVAPGPPQAPAKAAETVEPKRKKDDGPPWDMLQYSTK